MVDKVRVLRLLRSVTDDLAVLEQESQGLEVRRNDVMWLRGVKYTFITAIEACIDVAQHICSAEGWGPPVDNGDALRLLGKHSVLSPELATAMRKAVGFRNVLVHEYIAVSDEVVVAQLQDLSDLDAYVRKVTEFVTGS